MLVLRAEFRPGHVSMPVIKSRVVPAIVSAVSWRRKEGDMSRRLRVATVLLAAVALVIPAIPASASHKDDPHSRNLHPLGHTDENRGPTTLDDFLTKNFFTDIAFRGKIAVQGVWWGGFRTIDISAPGHPKVLSEVDCGVFQGDVGVYRNLEGYSKPATAAVGQVADLRPTSSSGRAPCTF
jgi:hypothetical protein